MNQKLLDKGKGIKREIKFRAWDKEEKKIFYNVQNWYDYMDGAEASNFGNVLEDYDVSQYTGLKDKNGKEIYEFMELDNKYEVDWLNGRYILRDISNGDIIDLDYENKYTITKEYTKV